MGPEPGRRARKPGPRVHLKHTMLILKYPAEVQECEGEGTPPESGADGPEQVRSASIFSRGSTLHPSPHVCPASSIDPAQGQGNWSDTTSVGVLTGLLFTQK